MSQGQGPVGGSMSAKEMRARLRAELERRPIDWSARFRAAALVADRAGLRGQAIDFRTLAADWPMVTSDEAAAIGRALLGEDA